MLNQCCATDKIPIVKGEDKDIDILLVYKDTGKPLDLTGAVITAKFLKADNTWLSKTATVLTGEEKTGCCKIALGDADTALLKADEQASFQLTVNKSGQITIVQFLKSLTIVESL